MQLPTATQRSLIRWLCILTHTRRSFAHGQEGSRCACSTTGVVLSGAALAEPSRFDGSWSVQLVADGGLLCGSGTSQTLTVQNGSVRAGGSGVSLSGQVGPSGSVNLALQRAGVQGSASGKLSGFSGSGSWTVATLGCSGRWMAQRQTVTAQLN